MNKLVLVRRSSSLALLLANCAGHGSVPATTAGAATAPAREPAAELSPAGATGSATILEKPRFDWPVGLSVQVSEVDREEDDGEETVLAQRYRRRTEAAPEGLVVIDDQMQLLPATSEGLLRLFLESFMGAEVRTTVTPEGKFVSSAWPADVTERMERALAKDEVPEELWPSLLEAATPEAMNASAQSDWHELIESWLPVLASDTGSLTRSVEHKLDALTEPVTASETVTIGGPVACTAGALEQRCVQLTRVVTLDQESVARAIARTNEQTAQQSGKARVVFEAVQNDERVTLLAERATLLPHSYAFHGELNVRANVAGSARQHTERKDRAISYEYTSAK